MTPRPRTTARLLAGVAALALAVTACGSSSGGGGGSNKASAPGITATTVTIGSHQPLTGPAAPGYSEIAPAAEAMFKYINSQGGINGRTIVYKYKDDGYNPTNTVDVVKQLVLQDKVFAIFNGLGTPTHTKVVDYLNSSRVPDLFVASGCQCWDQPKDHPYTFGWQTDYLVEGKILGQYIKQNFSGKKVGYLYQNDDFGQDGVKGLDAEIPSSMVVDKQPYETSQLSQPTGIAAQLSSLKAHGAEVLVLFTIPAATAVAQLTDLKIGYKPQLVVTNVGSDPTTLAGLLKNFSKGAAGGQLSEGIITDGYLPPTGDTSNAWITLFKKVHDQYIPNLPFDGNVEYGMAAAYTFAQVLKAAGKNPTRSGLVAAVEKGGLGGPGLVPYRYSKDSHAGFVGAQIGKITGGTIVLEGQPLTTTDDAGSAIEPYTGKQPSPGDNGVVKP